jgi:DNA modification methylase
MINKIHCGDNIELMRKLPDCSIDLVITSPPYFGLRNYSEDATKIWGGNKDCKHEWEEYNTKHQEAPGKTSIVQQKGLEYTVTSYKCRYCSAWKGQLGLEPTPKMYIQHLVEISKEIKRILKPTGSYLLNLGDSYSTGIPKVDLSPEEKNYLQSKQLLLIPSHVAISLQEDGWILRSDLIWRKGNPMPTPIKDRYNNSYEHMFFFVKQQEYFFNIDQIREPHKTIISPEAMEHIQKILQLAKDTEQVIKVGKEYIEKNHIVGSIKDEIKNYIQSDAGHPLGKVPTDVLDVNIKPFSEAHFAVFPEELVHKPIIAHCPERVCINCGTPWTREMIVDIEHNRENKREDAKVRLDGLERVPNDWEPKEVHGFEWKKNCTCESDYTPGIVLDIFNGSGTTCLVAKQLGRRYIGFDINPEYCVMAQNRVGKLGKLDSWGTESNINEPIKGFSEEKRKKSEPIVERTETKPEDLSWEI